MKKSLIILGAAMGMVGYSALGQGYLQIVTANNVEYNGFTTPGSSAPGGGTEMWALYWAPTATANPFAALTGLAATPISGNSQTSESWTAAQAWTALGAGGFSLAFDSTAYSQNVIDVVTAPGSVQYFTGDDFGTGAGFGIQGSSAGAVSLLLVGWNSANGATPGAATGANHAIGWSYLSTFNLVGSSTDPSIGSPTFTSFGVFNPVSAPEPSSLALAGLGGFGMLMAFRRKKA